MTGIIIKPVLPDSAPLLAEIHGASFSEGAWNLAQISGTLALATTRGWIAYAGGEPAGFILCQTAGDQAEILTFCVRPQDRRRRIGKALVRHVLDCACEEGVKNIFLEVAEDNIAACALYEKLGFTITGRRPGYYRRGAAAVNGVRYSRSV